MTSDATTFVRPMTLCGQVIILDGLTGTGKTMMSPMLSSFARVQNARFEYMFEYLCIAARSGKLAPDAATSLLNLLADVKCYDGMISREVNLRPSDLSSVFNSSSALKYLRQLFMPDGEQVARRIEAENPSLFLVTHQLLGCMQPAMDAFGGRLRIVQMVRHPLYLLNHWDSYIAMHGTNPRDFTIWLKHEGRSVPWFAKGWEREYLEMPQFDRVVYSIVALMRPVFEVHARADLRGVVSFLPFERFVLTPGPFLRELEHALGTKATPSTARVLRSQKVPRESINAGPQKSIYKRYALSAYDKRTTDAEDYDRLMTSAKERATAAAFQELQAVSNAYERVFGLWFDVSNGSVNA